jgi:hypothetical protein
MVHARLVRLPAQRVSCVVTKQLLKEAHTRGPDMQRAQRLLAARQTLKVCTCDVQHICLYIQGVANYRGFKLMTSPVPQCDCSNKL